MLPPRASFPHPTGRLLKIAVGSLLLLSISTTPGIAWDGQVKVSAKQRMERIILPSVEMNQTKLSDAMEFLRQTANQLEPNPNSASRLNIVLNPSTLSTPEQKITLNLHNIPLWEVLRYVAAQAGLKVKMEPHAICFVPLTEPDELVTATFRVAPAVFGNKIGVGGAKNALDQGATTAQ